MLVILRKYHLMSHPCHPRGRDFPFSFHFLSTFDPTTVQSQGFIDPKGGDYRVITGSLLGDYGEISTLSY